MPRSDPPVRQNEGRFKTLLSFALNSSWSRAVKVNVLVNDVFTAVSFGP